MERRELRVLLTGASLGCWNARMGREALSGRASCALAAAAAPGVDPDQLESLPDVTFGATRCLGEGRAGPGRTGPGWAGPQTALESAAGAAAAEEEEEALIYRRGSKFKFTPSFLPGAGARARAVNRKWPQKETGRVLETGRQAVGDRRAGY